MLRALALLALLLVAPVAAAQETLTLDDLEEPRKGLDATWTVQVTEEEAGAPRAVVFRNPVGQSFGLVVMNAAGETVFEKNGSRGLQTLPALDAGKYTFLVRFREGEFQVVGPAFGRTVNGTVQGTIEGEADAYVALMGKHQEFDVTGDVQAEWLDVRCAEPSAAASPATFPAPVGSGYVLTLRGAEGTPYTVTAREVSSAKSYCDDAAAEETPGAPLALLLAGALVVALARRRRA